MSAPSNGRSGGPWSGRRLHFIGVGGAGMSGYARAAHALGAQLSGSDGADSPFLARLREDGVLAASIGHDAANIPAGADVEVIYSSAVAAANPERAAARERGLSERPRAALLAEFTALKRTIAIAGTHGKTTTSAMLVHALRHQRELDPSWLIGAAIGGGLPNAHWGAGELLVVEADESDRSMLSLDVEIAVLTNVELDHHATFGSLRELRDAFTEFLARARGGVVVWNRPELLELAAAAAGAPARSTAVEPAAPAVEVVAPAVEVVPYDVPTPLLDAGGSSFRWREHEVRLRVPGAHNALNAAAALEAARLAGADIESAIAGLVDFRGAGRRFQPVGASRGGAAIYEDYAHHPTEVEATLRAARTLAHRRLVAVFQPHLFSRTALLCAEFARALALADVVAVLDVYPARERAADHPGVSGLLIAQAVADAARGGAVYWLPTFADAEPALDALLGEGDLCLVMGAGNVDELARRLATGSDAEPGQPGESGQAGKSGKPGERG
jgi:UDP-N-acetylmuramate--alanine ligase